MSISIHAPHAGRDLALPVKAARGKAISIHAPHAGRDGLQPVSVYKGVAISIHAPHAGRDPPDQRRSASVSHFNPRAPCGARPEIDDGDPIFRNISIHAPHAGRDHHLP